ncbi:MAG: 30S ribosome-binding factor RbfA [Gammaproteobacteria bacterium]|nr:30S ribosome-binding factor RbfA [Gammaproteobacteria bacterium]MDH3448426.1 30S ribosome-binding factor RbfA [Gammaproteobacteria bacterium]
MPREYARSERLASQIQRELAGLIRHGLKDPRLAAPSILEVQVSKDLAYAKVFFSVLNAEDAAGCLEALNRASGFLQREIGKQLKSRLTPKLSFIYDDTDIRGRKLSDLIDTAVASDKSKASQ